MIYAWAREHLFSILATHSSTFRELARIMRIELDWITFASPKPRFLSIFITAHSKCHVDSSFISRARIFDVEFLVPFPIVTTITCVLFSNFQIYSGAAVANIATPSTSSWLPVSPLHPLSRCLSLSIAPFAYFHVLRYTFSSIFAYADKWGFRVQIICQH